MTPFERDDFLHALAQTYDFYGKKLEKEHASTWFRLFADKPVDVVKAALHAYMMVGRFAPKPKDITEQMDKVRATSKASLPPPDTSYTPAPQHIADAWSWFIRMYSGHTFGPETNPAPETQDKYLHTVNHEARRLNMPDAIPDKYRLAEVWG